MKYSITKAVRAAWRALCYLCRRHQKPLLVTQDQYVARHLACYACEHYVTSSQQCRLCTCVVSMKAHFITEQCPATPSRWAPL